jgi:translation initiation factor 4A
MPTSAITKTSATNAMHDTSVTDDDDQCAFGRTVAVAKIQRFRKFDEMPLCMPLLRGIFSIGFEDPSDIQQRAIVPISKGGDVVAQAQAGSGKTGAFVIGLLARIDASVCRTQALILSPTRELAQQTYDVSLGIGQYLFPDEQAWPVALLSAGTRVTDDVAKLASGVTIAVGTPGRVLQLLEKGALRNDRLCVLVLDEADELLSQGFQEQIAKLFRFMPRDVQIVLVSATMPPEVRALSEKFMRDPTRILLEPDELPVESIKQFYIACDSDEKMLVLTDLYERISIAQSIIFVNSRRKAEYVAAELNRMRFAVALTHGDLSRDERDAVIKSFKAGNSRVLVTTDLLGRGIDVYHVNIVINYELPVVLEKYIHRVGRCGRYGRKGAAINLLAKEDLPAMRAIEEQFGIATTELPMNFTTLIA